MNNNPNSNTNRSTYIKTFLVNCLFGLCIGIEFAYREPLFDQSLIWIKLWRNSDSESINSFFSIITEFGSHLVLVPLFFLIFLFVPLNKSYSVLNAVIYSIFFDCLMKIAYGNPRPFWIDGDLYKHCDTGYGNPSGHSFTSAASWLSIWNVLTDYDFFSINPLGIFLRYFLLILAILLIFAIMISRVYLALHSVNQIIYGFTLGVGFYLLLFHIIKMNKMTGKEFFGFIRGHIYWAIWFILLLLTCFLVWGLVENPQKSAWLPELEKRCDEIKPYRLFNNDGLYGMLTIFAVIGGHLGLLTLFYVMNKNNPGKEDEILLWYKSGGFLNSLMRIGFSILMLLPLVTYFSISSQVLWINYFFKMSLPFIVVLFNLFFTAVYFTNKWELGNEKVFNQINVNANENHNDNSRNGIVNDVELHNRDQNQDVVIRKNAK